MFKCRRVGKKLHIHVFDPHTWKLSACLYVRVRNILVFLGKECTFFELTIIESRISI